MLMYADVCVSKDSSVEHHELHVPKAALGVAMTSQQHDAIALAVAAGCTHYKRMLTFADAS
jgi:hypothetical protein